MINTRSRFPMDCRWKASFMRWKLSRDCMVCALTVTALLGHVPEGASADPPVKLRPTQLIQLLDAARERYWSLSYRLSVKSFPYVHAGNKVAKKPNVISSDVWRWQPWRLYCFQRNTIHGGYATAKRYSEWWCSDKRFIWSMKTWGASKTLGNTAVICQVSNGSRIAIYGSLVDTIWCRALGAGVTDKNSKVDWDPKSHEYILQETLRVWRKPARYQTWVDPTRGFVVTRRNEFTGGKLFLSQRFSHWRRVGKNLWLPLEVATIAPGEAIDKSTVGPDVKVNVPLSNSDFRLDFPNGAVMYDNIKGKVYRVGQRR